MFSVGDFVEAVDECGHWATAKVVETSSATILVTFVGWSSRFNRWVENDAVRHPAATESENGAGKRPKRKTTSDCDGMMRRLVRGDMVRISAEGVVYEAEVFRVDKFNKLITVQTEDGKRDVHPNMLYSDEDDQYTKLYHYTDKTGSKAIARSGYIKQSVEPKKKGTDDARHGTGTYLTSLGPETSKKDVASNNYGQNSAAAMVRRGKADVAIEITLPKKDVERVSDKRDIHVHRGDVQLEKKTEPKFHIRHSDGRVTTHRLSSAEDSDKYSQ